MKSKKVTLFEKLVTELIEQNQKRENRVGYALSSPTTILINSIAPFIENKKTIDFKPEYVFRAKNKKPNKSRVMEFEIGGYVHDLCDESNQELADIECHEQKIATIRLNFKTGAISVKFKESAVNQLADPLYKIFNEILFNSGSSLKLKIAVKKKKV